MEESASRTARLQALRAAKERRAQANPDAASTGEAAASDAAATTGPKVIFRNYQPTDKSLQETSKLPRAGVVKPAIAAKVADDDNVLNVIAKKANWDLKRDLQPKLQKLERRTEVPTAQPIQPFPVFNSLGCVAVSLFCRRPFATFFGSRRKRELRKKRQEIKPHQSTVASFDYGVLGPEKFSFIIWSVLLFASIAAALCGCA
jgi:coiled-coil domain-containing protein 12